MSGKGCLWLSLAFLMLLPQFVAAQVCSPVSGQPDIGFVDLMGSVSGPRNCGGVFACNQPTVAGVRYETQPPACDPTAGPCAIRASVPFQAPGNSQNTDFNFRPLVLEWTDPNSNPAGSCGAGNNFNIEDGEAWIQIGGFSCGASFTGGVYELRVRACPCLTPPFCVCDELSTMTSVDLTEPAIAAAVCPPPPRPWGCGEGNSCQAGCMGPNGTGAGGQGSGGSSAAGGGPGLGGSTFGGGAFVRYQAGGVGEPGQPLPADWTTILGRYWSHDYAERIVPDPDDSHVWLLTRYATFREFTDADLDGTYETAVPSDEYRELTKTPTGWELRELDGMIHAYDLQGRWSSTTDRNGNAKTAIYDAMNRLERVDFPDGRHELFAYDGAGRLDTITEVGVDDTSTRVWDYDWTGDDLTGIDRPDGRSWSLRYDDAQNPGFMTRLTLIGDDGTSERIEGAWEYDEQGNVVATWRGAIDKNDPDAVDRWLFSFDDPALPVTTTVTDPLGTVSMHTFGRDDGSEKPRLEGVSGDCPTSCGAGPNSTTSYTDAAHPLRPTSITNGRGFATQMTYDSFGQLMSRTEAFGQPEERTTVWEYSATFPALITRIERPSTTGDPLDLRVTELMRDANGNVERQIEEGVEDGSAFSLETVMTYTPEGMLETLDGPDHGTADLVTFVYDTANRGGLVLDERIDPIIGTTDFGHDAFNRRTSVIDVNSVETATEYDPADRLRFVRRRGAAGDGSEDLVTESRYTTFGDLFQAVLPEQNVVEYSYDTIGRLTAVERKPDDQPGSHGQRVRYGLNAFGQRDLEIFERWETDAWVEHSRIDYDYATRCHLDSITIGSGTEMSRTEYTYDCNNNLMQSWDANQDRDDGDPPSTTFQYDSLDRLVEIQQPFGGGGGGMAETRYTYDTQDHLASIEDGERTRTTYEYSDRDLLTSETSEVSGLRLHTYSSSGMLATSTDARGVVESREYDALDRLVRIDFPDDSQDVVRVFDDPNTSFSTGRLSRISREGRDIEYEYDRFGRVLRDGELIYSYDRNGNRTRIEYPGGESARYMFDFADRESELEFDDGQTLRSVVTSANYLPSGPLDSLTFGNSLQEQRSYDSRYFPSRIEVVDGSSPILDWDYTVDPVGNPTSIVDLLNSANNRSFGYQPYQYFITEGSGPWGSRVWTYDKSGNRLTEIRDGGNPDIYSYSPNLAGGNSPQLDLVQLGVMGQRDLAYDSAGNRTRVDVGGNVIDRTYDDAGRLSSQQRPLAEARTSFLYDGRGFLRQAEGRAPAPSGTGVFCDGFESGDTSAWGGGGGGSTCLDVQTDTPLYSSGGLLHAVATSEGPTRILYFAGRPVSQTGAHPMFLTTDYLGTPILATDEVDGSTIWTGGFEPFGGDYSGAVQAGVILAKPGQWRTAAWDESDLGDQARYNLHRWYTPSSGSFTRPDPIGLVVGGANPYYYAEQNPSRFVDPSGLATCVLITGMTQPLDSFTFLPGHAGMFFFGPCGSSSGGDSSESCQSPAPFLYDPNGGYPGRFEGVGQSYILDENIEDWSLFDYFDYHCDGRSASIEVYCFQTTCCEEQQIQERIGNGGSLPLGCSLAVTGALNTVGPFGSLGSGATPGLLRRSLNRVLRNNHSTAGVAAFRCQGEKP